MTPVSRPAKTLPERWRDVVQTVTAFTLAHSLTLALATTGVLLIPGRIVEPLIAASIVYVGVENLIKRVQGARWKLTFGFGLVHGLGFATVLRDLGVGTDGNGAIALPRVVQRRRRGWTNGGRGRARAALLVAPLSAGFAVSICRRVVRAGDYGGKLLADRTNCVGLSRGPPIARAINPSAARFWNVVDLLSIKRRETARLVARRLNRYA